MLYPSNVSGVDCPLGFFYRGPCLVAVLLVAVLLVALPRQGVFAAHAHESDLCGGGLPMRARQVAVGAQ